MKLDEILFEEQIGEGPIRTAIAAGLISLTPFMSAFKKPAEPVNQKPVAPSYIQKYDEVDELTQLVVKYRHVNPTFAKQVVILAKKYEDPVFPKARDILAIIGIESNYKPGAVSNLKHDPARGLMQVRAGVWKIDKNELASTEAQIKHGAGILKLYYTKLNGDIPKTISAYNHGLSSVRHNKHDDRYYNKYSKEMLALYRPVDY